MHYVHVVEEGSGTPVLTLSSGQSDVPVSVVVGRRDSLVGWHQQAGLLAAYPNAHAVIVADAGHALPHERPQALRYAARTLGLAAHPGT